MRIYKWLLSAALAMQTLWAQSPIEQPQIGLYRDSRGTLRRLLGVTGAFTAGDALRENVQGAESFSDVSVLQAEGQVTLLGADGTPQITVAEPAAHLLFAADATGKGVQIADPDGRLWLLTGQGLTESPLSSLPTGTLALSVSANGDLLFAKQDRDQLCVHRAAAHLAQPVTERCVTTTATSARLLIDGTLVWTTEEAVFIQRSHSEPVRRAVPKGTWQLQHVGGRWLLVADAQRMYLLHPSTTGLFELPTFAQSTAEQPAASQENPPQENHK